MTQDDTRTVAAVGFVLGLALGLLVTGCDGKPTVYDRPLGNCVEMRDLLRNRPHPPPHGVHSHARPVPVCKEQQ